MMSHFQRFLFVIGQFLMLIYNSAPQSHKIRRNMNVKFTNSPQPTTNVCAIVMMKDSSLVIIPPSHKHTALALLGQEYNETVPTSEITEILLPFQNTQNCRLSICGYISSKFEIVNRRENIDVSCSEAIVSVGKLKLNKIEMDEIGTINCACQKNSSTLPNCSKLCYDVIPTLIWRTNMCGMLFKEELCFKCYYPPKIMNAGEAIEITAFSIRSLIVRLGYGMTLTPVSDNATIYETERFDLLYYTDISYSLTCEEIKKRANSSIITTNTTVPVPVTNKGEHVLGAEQESKDSKIYYLVPAAGIIVALIGSAFVVIIAILLIKRKRKKRILCDITIEDRTELKDIGCTFKPLATSKNNLPEALKNRIKIDVPTFCNLMSEQELLEKFSQYLQSLHEARELEADGFMSRTLTQSNKNDLPKHKYKFISNPKFELKRESFIAGELLGSGKFGDVHKGILKGEHGTTKHVAIKSVKSREVGDTVIKSFLREIKILSYLENHDNIVGFVGACIHSLRKGEIYVLTEFCQNGSLEDYLKTEIQPVLKPATPQSVYKSLGQPDEDGYTDDSILEAISEILLENDFYKLMLWAEQVANGMEFLNLRKVIHVDVATRNILLDKYLSVKICDFGLSKKCLDPSEYAQSLLSGQFPANSIAPECLKFSTNRNLSVSSYTDVWAYGCALWEIFSLGIRAYTGMTIFEISGMLCRKERLEQPRFAPDNVYGKMLECWNEIPEDRPTFTELKLFFATEKSSYSV